MPKSLSRRVALMFVLALAFPTTVLAQTANTADVHGVVLDASGQPAAGYPMKISTPQSGEVIIKPTEIDGTFGVEGLPPGNYELRVFEPGGSSDHPIASKQVTLAAGQAPKIEIRVGSDNPGAASAPKPAAARPATGMPGTTGVYWKAGLIAAAVIAAGLVFFFVARGQGRPAS